MSDGTAIEWTDATWNVVNGCSVVSPGCKHCYAMKLAGGRLKNVPSRKGLTIDTQAGPVWTGETRFNEAVLLDPLKWKRPRRIFVCAHGDLFHESVPDEWIDRVFAVMALAHWHQFQVLTKRPDRMRAYLTGDRGELKAAIAVNAMRQGMGDLRPVQLPLQNVWLGTSVEDQKRADERIPDLLATPAAVRFLSCEPLLGPVDLREFNGGHYFQNALTGHRWHDDPEGGAAASDDAGGKIDWVIAGGESGPGARPMHPDWARQLRDQCAEAGVPFFFKQWGAWVPQVGAVDGWAIGDDPELSRFDHRDWDATAQQFGKSYRPAWCDERDDDTVSRIGKKLAGNMLDGRQHLEMPV